MISEGVFSGSMFSPAQMPHCANRHVEEVFPGLGLEVLEFLRRHFLAQFGERGRRVHEDRAAAVDHLLQHDVIAQAGARHAHAVFAEALFVLDDVAAQGAEVLAGAVHQLGLEQQEPCAHWAVAVLEARRHEAVLHHGHFGAGFRRHRVGRARVPHRIPGAARTLAHGARAKHVDRAAAGQHAGLELVDVELVLAHREARCARDAGRVVLVVDQAHDENALLDIIHAERFLRRLGDDPLVGLAVDHDLPLARAHRLAA